MKDPNEYVVDIENIGSPDEGEDGSIYPSPNAPHIGTDGTQTSLGSGHSSDAPIERNIHGDTPSHLPN
jgi:hypothetical protein